MSKKFIVLGNQNAITYKGIFPLIKDSKIWLGCSTPKEFMTPLSEVENPKTQYKREDGKVMQKFGNICWFTNLDHKKRHYKMDFYKMWSRCADEYQKYDNYDAINVDKTCDIPLGYKGVLGVPITFLDKYCPEQFEILDARDFAYYDKQKKKETYLIKDADGAINGKPTYARILIRFRDGEGEEIKEDSNVQT